MKRKQSPAVALPDPDQTTMAGIAPVTMGERLGWPAPQPMQPVAQQGEAAILAEQHAAGVSRQLGGVVGTGVGEFAEEVLRHLPRFLLDHIGRHQPAGSGGRVDEGHALSLQILDRLAAGIARRDE